MKICENLTFYTLETRAQVNLDIEFFIGLFTARHNIGQSNNICYRYYQYKNLHCMFQHVLECSFTVCLTECLSVC